MARLWDGLARGVRCGGALRWLGPFRDPSGTLPGPPAVRGPRGTLPAPWFAVLPATFQEICVSGARGSAFFRPPAALGLRPVPCCSLARGLRSAPRSVGVRVMSWRGWSGFVCACFVGCWVCSVCAWFMASQVSPGRRSVAGVRTVAALGRWGCVAGASVRWGPSACGRKNAENSLEVAGVSALGVPFCGRSRYAA